MEMRRALMLVAVALAAACQSGDNASPKGSAAPTASQSATTPSSADRTGSGAPTALGGPRSANTSPAPSMTGAPTAARPLYYDRPITAADLAGRTLREYALLRNTIYARAGNKFRRPWLNAYFGAQPWYKPLDVMDESKITATDRANARAIADADASLSREELTRRSEEVLARRKAGKEAPEDAVEMSLLSQRLGTWLGGDAAPTEARSPLEDPSQLDRLLRVEELSTLSRRDLRILRNTVYARRGRSFDSAVVKEYFKGAKWYHPDPSYHDGRLTEIDHKNIRIIKSIEDSVGGPLHENPEYGRDGWFAQA